MNFETKLKDNYVENLDLIFTARITESLNRCQ